VNDPVLPPVDGADLVGPYEQLRQDVLSQAARASVGVTLFLRHGMAEWIRACSRAAPSIPAPAPPTAISPWSCDVRVEATSILAGILLSYRSETTPCKPTCRR
jgi:hypothetical protein